MNNIQFSRNLAMQAEKLSISLPTESVRFIEAYQSEHGIRSRSQVVEFALRMLREQSLEAAYREASGETDPAWDVVNRECLANEAWCDLLR
jgi:Arc/MetJ-type ribon-helix-helix transcriptional regulator